MPRSVLLLLNVQGSEASEPEASYADPLLSVR